MSEQQLPSLERLAAALTAYQEIAAAARQLGARAGAFGSKGVYMETRLEWGFWTKAARLILAEWNDSNDPAEIHTSLDGWHGEIQSQGFRIALTNSNGMARLGLYLGAHIGDALGDPIILDEI